MEKWWHPRVSENNRIRYIYSNNSNTPFAVIGLSKNYPRKTWMPFDYRKKTGNFLETQRNNRQKKYHESNFKEFSRAAFATRNKYLRIRQETLKFGSWYFLEFSGAAYAIRNKYLRIRQETLKFDSWDFIPKNSKLSFHCFYTYPYWIYYRSQGRWLGGRYTLLCVWNLTSLFRNFWPI